MFCTSNDTINRVNCQPTEWERLFLNHISDKRLVSSIWKALLQLNNKNTNNLLKIEKGLNRHFSHKIYKWPKKHMKRCLTALVINKM